ncbi:MAG: hypothetical protein ACOY3P_14535 [Planctomycetota bacterium]
MLRAALHRLTQIVIGTEPVVGLLWLGLLAFTVALVVLMWTRWGQYRPLRKCLFLSLLAHCLLAGYATTVNIVLSAPAAPEEVTLVSLDELLPNLPEPDDANEPAEQAAEKPWERPAEKLPDMPHDDGLDRAAPPDLLEPTRQARTSDNALLSAPNLAELTQVLMPAITPELDPLRARETTAKPPETVDSPTAVRREAPGLPMPPPAVFERPSPQFGNRETALEAARRTKLSTSDPLLTAVAPLPRMQEPRLQPDPAEAMADLTERLSASTSARVAEPAKVVADEAPAEPAAGVPSPSAFTSLDRRMQAVTLPPGNYTPSGNILHEPAAGAVAVPPPAPLARATTAGAAPVTMPDAYTLRMSPDRAKLAERRGGSEETERAVKAALAWLAANQLADGRWDASAHGSGREQQVLGRDRQNAGIEADTGVTGLALLAFLASGHTHTPNLARDAHTVTDGPDYTSIVRRGIDFLLRSQRPDGNLAGEADPYARMYCHGMATIALSEAYGMTGDASLRDPVARAVAYTVACQHPGTGGWRYTPADPGDTSQLGWQWMALKSAELAGIPVPARTRDGVVRFLRSVSYGRSGGLASYRPGEATSRSMTAEALFCWQLLGQPQDNPACCEAAEYLLGELPGTSRHNCYYWYYATLALYQLQGDAWQQWNAALRPALLAAQVQDGPQAGSWETNTVWGGYGGQVYTTAISALTLEVYYRYLPLYAQRQPARK